MEDKKILQSNINLNTIESPAFLTSLNYDELNLLSKQINDYLINIISKKGGHLSSNLGAIDATIALCRSFNFKKDKVIFDVGHQTYTYKLLTGRKLSALRIENGVSGFQKMDESEFDHFEAGHSSTSISVANGFAIARDLKKENYNVIAFIGDASIANGLAFEGLNNASLNNHKIIIVLNDNGMSISPSVGALASSFKKLDLNLKYDVNNKKYNHNYKKAQRLNRHTKQEEKLFFFESLGYEVIGPIDGHNIQEMEQAFNKAKECNKSVVVYLKTRKGNGYKPAQEDKVGLYHGVASFNIDTGEIEHNVHALSWDELYAEILFKEMKTNSSLITIVPATTSCLGFAKIANSFPDRFINVGINESHALALAGALAKNGFHPVVSIYSTFLQRGYDQIIHDLARTKSNVTLLIGHAGFVGRDGETHQGIYDQALLNSIPDSKIAIASRPSEAYGIFLDSLKEHGVFAIRYPLGFIKKEDHFESVSFASWKQELFGEETAIVSSGPVTLLIKEELIKIKSKVSLFNAIYQRPIDLYKARDLLSYKKVIIYDVYGIKEGFAQYLLSYLLEIGYKGKIIIKAIPDDFVLQGSIEEQINRYELSIKDLLKNI